MGVRKFFKAIAGTLALAVALPLVASAAGTVVVTPANNQGWVFNGDPTTSTPYNFTEDEASIGEGSLFVQPIGANPLDKFIAAKTVGSLVTNFQSVSYDFLIAGDGTPADAQHFYLNVYTNLSGSSTFYDCRFDYVPTTGSTTDFTTATFSKTDTPVNVGDRPDAFTCPATLAGMPAGSTVKFVALNVGDTSINDQGLAGYLDKAVIATTGDTTTYDFELTNVPTNKNQCKNGGYVNYTDENGEPFTNQGQCVSFVQSNRSTVVNNNNVSVVNNSNQQANSGSVNGGGTSGNASNGNSSSFNVVLSNF